MLLDENTIRTIEEYYVPFKQPIPYKEWLLYPIKVKDSFLWLQCSYLLNLDQQKNTTGNIEYISATYLEYLFLLEKQQKKDNSNNQNCTILDSLCQILYTSLGLSKDRFLTWYYNDDELCLAIGDRNDLFEEKYFDESKLKIITSQDFDQIRKIISYQNINNFDDSYVDPDVQKAIDDVNNFKKKKQSNGQITTMKQIAVVQQSLGLTHEQIMEMGYREFMTAFNLALDKTEYMCLRIAETNPDISFKQPLEHYAYEYKRNITDGVFVDYDNLSAKVSV